MPIIECANPWFSLIKEGTKPVEGRKGTKTWIGIKVGDTLTFTDGEDTKNNFDTIVVGVNKYDGKEALIKYLETETLARALPGIKTIEEGMKIYHQWSTPDEITRHGFIGIQIERIVK